MKRKPNYEWKRSAKIEKILNTLQMFWCIIFHTSDNLINKKQDEKIYLP